MEAALKGSVGRDALMAVTNDAVAPAAGAATSDAAMSASQLVLMEGSIARNGTVVAVNASESEVAEGVAATPEISQAALATMAEAAAEGVPQPVAQLNVISPPADGANSPTTSRTPRRKRRKRIRRPFT